MKRIATIFILVSFLAGFVPLFAVETGNAPKVSLVSVTPVPPDPVAPAAAAHSARLEGNTIFQKCSSLLSNFDKTYSRRHNKQGFWNATADWMRNINKQ